MIAGLLWADATELTAHVSDQSLDLSLGLPREVLKHEWDARFTFHDSATSPRWQLPESA